MQRRTFLGCFVGLIPAVMFWKPQPSWQDERVFCYGWGKEWVRLTDGSWKETNGSYQHGWHGPGPTDNKKHWDWVRDNNKRIVNEFRKANPDVHVEGLEVALEA